MSSSVFKVYEEDRDRNLLLPQEEIGGLDDSSTTEDGTCPVEATTSSGSSAGGSVVDERLKIDSNLVIVVGKDGSVHVDQKTLHSLLANETTDTSVSVVRIASPTPSIEDEIEQERRQKLEDEQLQQELEAAGLVPDEVIDGTGSEDSPESSNAGPSTSRADPAPTAGPSGVSTRRSKAGSSTTAAKKEDVLLDGGDPPHVSLMVEGFYPPEEARKFAAEVLTLAGLRKPLTVETEPVDYEFQRYVVANDHCYTPLTSPSQKLPPRSFEEQIEETAQSPSVAPQQQQQQQQKVVEEGPSGRRRVAAVISKVSPTKQSRPRKKSVEETGSSNDAEDLQSILEGSDSDSDYTEESSYPEEDDNLSDLDFDITGKSQSKKRKSGSSKNKSGSKKKDETGQAEKKKSLAVGVKSPTKKSEIKLVTPVSMVTKSAVPKTYGPKKTLEVVTPPVPTVVAPPAPVLQVKKIKQVPKPAPHVEALFTDMTSLFSTPDIIKKVGQSKAVTPTTPTTPTPSGSRGGFVQLSKSTSQKLPAQISIQTHASASEESLIDVLAQDPESTPTAIATTPTPLTEDIVKMLENNLPPGVGGGVQEPVLPITDNSILAALGSSDDGGLPEDLLQHVAELAENKELQEILDKQVLGVIGTEVPPMPLASTSAAIHIAPQHMMQPVITPPQQPVLPRSQAQQSPAPTPVESLPTMTVKEQLMPRKEAIQIRRSDGRIITLPPIEAPATRSKRRAQTGTSGTPVATSPATAPVAASPSTPIQSVSVVPSASSHTPQSSKTPSSSKSASKSSIVGITSYDDGSGSLMIDETPRGKASGANRSAASSRRTSESSNNSGRGKRQSTAAVAAVVAAEAAEDEVESDESWNSEDDPDRLWCICRQPHNNRFMICCDVCEDWFHGKCVNITKAMGQQMEADGIEWTCPNCLKKKQEKQQPKMTDFLVSSSSSSTSIGTGSATALTMSPKTVASITSASTPAKTADQTSCVVCAKPARANSVYCSDSCIRKHAHGVVTDSSSQPARSTVAVATKQQTIVDGIKKMDSSAAKDATSKSGPIIVMERKTGRCLTGKNAPTAENLKAWLQSHPTFEVVPPGSPQAAIILAKQAEVRKLQQAKESQKKSTSSLSASQPQQTSKSQSQKHSESKKNTLFAPSIPQKVTPTAQSSKAPPSKTSSKTSISTPTTAPPKSSSSSGSLGGSAKTPISTTATTPSSASKSQKRPASAMDAKSSATAATAKTTPPAPGGENIRVTVKKTLKEHLLQRTSELDGDKSGTTQQLATRLTESEIDAFVAEVEEEMFAMFNKDTGTKYRAKYRSLVFNIKDRKNLSLFQKICEKRIEARQLVRMTPEELASQELAQWRENENKHQLEMIKKSELDLLACAKNYVLKTHKGEEVIEGKIVDRVQLDPTTAVEDVVAVLNNSTVSSTSELDNSTKDASFRSKDFDLSFGKYSTGLYGSGSITSSTLSATATASSSSSASKKRDSRRSRSRSRSRDRRRDRSRDRSRSKHKRRRSRSRSRSRDRARSRHRDHRKQDSKEQKLDEKPATTSVEKERNEAIGKPVEAKKTKKVAEGGVKSQVPESGNLIDQILASAGAAIGKPAGDSTELDSTPVTTAEESPKQTLTTTMTTATTSPSQDQEPTSTVTIPTPPHSTEFDAESPQTDFAVGDSPEEDNRSGEALKIHWTGNVHMVDVASVEMSIRSVSGSIDDVAKDFSEDLDICGTIKPEIVWDYIGQIKKSANKEICLVRFHSNERAAYYTLYTHLFSRKRYSVIKSPSKAIKDFYVFPLPSEQMIPMILKPLTGVGIVEGDKKPDLLLGIIVKVCGNKRSLPLVSPGSASSAKTPRRTTKSSSSSGSTAVSPSFALMQQVITKYATKKPDLDTSTPPGSPGGTPSAPPPPSLASLPKPPPPPPAPPVIQIRSRSASESPEQADIDMDIIKRPALKSASSAAPVVPTEVSVPPPVVIDDDDDEPYSPGGASDDSDQFADVTAIVETKAGKRVSSALDPDSERIRLEMEEINRKIAEEKSEIVGIISSGELKADEIKSTLTPSLITDIAIPSNLSEILASINKSVPGVPLEPAPKVAEKKVVADDEEEYVPTAPSLYSAYKPSYSYGKPTAAVAAAPIPVLVPNPPPEASTSKLSKLSDAELLSMVPDDSNLKPAKTSTTSSKSRIADGDVVDLDSDDSDPPQPKKSKFDGATSEPPPPGLEDEIDLA